MSSEQSLSKILAMHIFIGKQKSCASSIVRLHFYSTGLHDTHTYVYNDSTYNITEWAKRSARRMWIFLWLLYHDTHFSGDFLSRKAVSLCQREQMPNQNLFMILFLTKTLRKYNLFLPFSLKAKRCQFYRSFGFHVFKFFKHMCCSCPLDKSNFYNLGFCQFWECLEKVHGSVGLELVFHSG